MVVVSTHSSSEFSCTYSFSGNKPELTDRFSGASTAKILNNLKKDADERNTRWNMVRVTYIGDPGVGKTTLANAVATEQVELEVLPCRMVIFTSIEFSTSL
tara:strand:- start:663 stop:965 length:303 start_codon:yes stop_codon:yes gene_type:complete